MPVLPRSPEKSTVLGLPIHLLEDYPGWLIEQIQQRQGAHVVTLNAEMSMQAEQDATLADVIRRADLVIPDGSGVVFYLSLRGKHVRRYPGIELAEALLEQSVECEPPCSVFFYGGSPEVIEAAAKHWHQRLPELAIAGIQHGYISPEEQLQLRQTLQTLQPQIILVGLGVPRQEFWIAENRHLCPRSLWIGVGGSFDIWSGTKTRAPVLFRRLHLEWMYRLYQEPWRWRRMLALPKFAWRAIAQSRH